MILGLLKEITPCCYKHYTLMYNIFNPPHKIIVCPQCLTKYGEYKPKVEFIASIIEFEYI